MIRLVGHVVDHAAHGVAAVQGSLRAAQHLDAGNVVQRALGGGDAEIGRVDAVVVGAHARVPAEAPEVPAHATDLDVPVGPGGGRNEVDHLVGPLDAHVLEKVLAHGRDRDGRIGNGGLDLLAVYHYLFDASCGLGLFRRNGQAQSDAHGKAHQPAGAMQQIHNYPSAVGKRSDYP